MSKKKVISIADSQAGLRCGSMSAKQMGGHSGGCTRIRSPDLTWSRYYPPRDIPPIATARSEKFWWPRWIDHSDVQLQLKWNNPENFHPCHSDRKIKYLPPQYFLITITKIFWQANCNWLITSIRSSDTVGQPLDSHDRDYIYQLTFICRIKIISIRIKIILIWSQSKTFGLINHLD